MMGFSWRRRRLMCGFYLSGAVVLALTAGGCNQVRTSDKDLSFVDPAAGEDLVRGGSSGVLGMGEAKTGTWVDCRPAKDFQERHIPGAISMPYEVVSDEHTSLTHYSPIIVYGDTYNDSRATGMAKRLIELGHSDVYTLRGGLDSWTKAGREVEGTKKDGATQ
jgi:rhodanese-related sulfurtransferase